MMKTNVWSDEKRLNKPFLAGQFSSHVDWTVWLQLLGLPSREQKKHLSYRKNQGLRVKKF